MFCYGKVACCPGVKTVILDLNQDAAQEVARKIENEFNIPSFGISASVLDKKSLEMAMQQIYKRFGGVDILINGAGGNSPDATAKIEKMEGTMDENPERPFSDSKSRASIRYLILISKVLSYLLWFSHPIW